MNDLYQQMIIDHSKAPRGYSDNPQGVCVRAHNPLCGDEINMCMTMDQGLLNRPQFSGSGCSLMLASASILTQLSEGITLREFQCLMDMLVHMVTTWEMSVTDSKLAIFSGVYHYPMRVKCVTMPWHCAREAITNIEQE